MQAPDESDGSEVVVALSTCPNEDIARSIAETLVAEGLAACVNRLAGVRSTYIWDGRLQDDPEILLMIKSCRARLRDLEGRLKTLHPYALPELVVLPVAGGNEGYLEWVREGVKKGMNE